MSMLMTPTLKSVFSLGVPGLAVLASLGAAPVQQEGPPRFDAAQVASQLELTADQQRQIAPDLEELNQLFVRETQLRQEPAGSQAHVEVMKGFSNVTARIGAALTPSQWGHFELMLDQAWARSQGFDGSVRRSDMRGYRNEAGRRMDRQRMGNRGGMGWRPGCCWDDWQYNGYDYGSRRSGHRNWGGCRW